MELFGYLCCLLIGLSLGLVGASGSILTVPIMVYLIGIEQENAATYSLVVVGLTAGFGAFQKRDQVQLNTAVGSLSAQRGWCGGRKVFSLRFSQIGFLNFRNQVLGCCSLQYLCLWQDPRGSGRRNLSLVFLLHKESFYKDSSLVSGQDCGGFLIVPALVLFAGLSMKQAIATSLLVVAANCAVGVASVWSANFAFGKVALIVALSLIGMVTGTKYADATNQKSLQRMFGYLVIIIALWIFLKEIFGKRWRREPLRFFCSCKIFSNFLLICPFFFFTKDYACASIFTNKSS